MNTHEKWVSYATEYSTVLNYLSEGKPPPYRGPSARGDDVAYLEALGRVAYSLTPFLSLTQDELPAKCRGLHSKISAQLHSALQWYFSVPRRKHSQNIIDFAYLVPSLLMFGVDATDYARQLRGFRPLANNWLLAAARIEAYLFLRNEEWDPLRVDCAIRHFSEHYAGDSYYCDGPEFRFDYYNSLVIHPYLDRLRSIFSGVDPSWDGLLKDQPDRSRRHAQILERLISPEGYYPVIGRSACYRMGVLNHLASHALASSDSLGRGRAVAALTTVMERQRQHTFDTNGLVTVGFHGYQPKMAEEYITTSSVYACGFPLRLLGIPYSDPAWCASSWSATSVYEQDALADESYHNFAPYL